jgi:anti-sigma factor ChrR (cupin superfamily)
MLKEGRRVFSLQRSAFGRYDLDGPLQDDISLLEVSYDRASGNGCYVMRMQPGATSVPHVHGGTEDFLILEGELVDEDGTVFRQGDFVSYAPGTRHHSWTDTGCLIAVFEWGKPD